MLPVVALKDVNVPDVVNKLVFVISVIIALVELRFVIVPTDDTNKLIAVISTTDKFAKIIYAG